MAYNDKTVITDLNGNVVPQFYNPDTDQYEVLTGGAGANKVVFFDEAGNEVFSTQLVQPIVDKLDQLTGTVIAEQSRVEAEQARSVWEAYDPLKQYVIGNKVVYNGSSYYCIQDTLGNDPTNSTYWLLIASIGNQGVGITDITDNLDGTISITYGNGAWTENVTLIGNIASNVSYSNATSGLTATTVQDAIDEIDTNLDNLSEEIQTSQTSTHTQTLSSIKSVPVGTVDGVVNDFEAKGLSLVNSVVNEVTNNKYTGWAKSSGSSNIIDNGNGTITVTDDSATTYNGAYTNSIGEIPVGDTIFVYFADMWHNHDENANWAVNLGYNSDNAIIYLRSGANEGGETYKKVQVTQAVNQLNVYLADTTPSLAETHTFTKPLLINMTALGIEDFTEAQMLDLVRGGYFSGLKGVENAEVKTVGKNLFDVNIYTPINYENRAYDVIDFSQSQNLVGKTLTISHDVKANFSQYKVSNSWTGTTIATSTANTFTFTVEQSWIDNGYKLFIGYAPGVTIDFYSLDVQIEFGNTATPYEPYKSSQLTINVPLRSLPNGVADRVYESDGQVWLEKNVESGTLGANKVVNGTFDADTNWSKGTGWSISGGVAVSNGSGAGIYLSQGSVLEVGKLYKIELDLNYTSGTFGFLTAHYETPSNILLTVSGKKIIYVVAKSTTLYFYSSSFVGSIDNVVVRECDRTTIGINTSTQNSGGVVSDDVTIHYQLATPQLINLTEQGLTSGELMAFENGTVYNTSDTFHSPDVSFKVASNRSAQIDSLLDSANTQAKQIEAKANKVQEDWIEPTLLNGWVNMSTIDQFTAYMKDNFGFVHLKGAIKSGITTNGTLIFLLPAGYRPERTADFIIPSNSASCGIYIDHATGSVKIRFGANAAWLALNGISFKAGE